ncbi:MAG: caspase family protein, partial [Bacteroidota bacterium]
DGLDECLCPFDFDWSEPHMIRDKQLHEVFDRIPEGVQAIFVSDSCHSGDLTRDPGGLGGRVAKRLIPPADLGWRIEAAQRSGFVTKNLSESLPNIALISGCKSDQTSADAHFGGRPNGALTFFLLQVLNAPEGLSIPLTTVGERVRALLTQNNYEQQPQVEGPDNLISRPFFK